MSGHSSHTLGMHGWELECTCMEAVIGVMSKRSVALAAAEKPGASKTSTSWLRRS
jgi:hypothetical protein